MRKRLKKVVLLTAFLPAFAVGQATQDKNMPQSVSASGSVDAEKAAAISDLITAIDGNRLADAISKSAQLQAKQLVVAVVSEALIKNKNLTNAQKQLTIPILQKETIPKISESAGHIFTTSQFKNDTLAAERSAYDRYYSTQEIKDLARFYKSAVGRKFIRVQDQVGHEVVNDVVKKYMPNAIQEIRQQAELAITTAVKSKPSETLPKTGPSVATVNNGVKSNR